MVELIAFLIVVGLALVVLEWYLPSGASGILGGCALVAAVVLAYREHGAMIGSAVLAGVIVGIIVLTVVWLNFFPRMKMGRKLTLEQASGGELDSLTRLVGKEGEAVSSLRPAGIAKIDGQRVDVVTEGGMIEPGSRVRVVKVEGHRVVVRDAG